MAVNSVHQDLTALPAIAADLSSSIDPSARRRHHGRKRRRRKLTLRPRMRFDWWQLWLAALAIALCCGILASMQPWRSPPPANGFY